MFQQWLSGPVITLVLLTPLLVHGGSMPAGDPGPRPQISEFEDQHTFVKALLAWQRRMQQWHPTSDAPAASEPPLRDDQKDWHRVTGPEDLETAVSNAAGYQQPHYRENQRFNRSTHISFPLAPLPQDLLADKVVEAQTPDDKTILPALPDPLSEPDNLKTGQSDPHPPISFSPTERREVSTRMR